MFLGQDNLSKNERLLRIKREFFPPELENFNLDILYAGELSLKVFQERLLVLPVQAKKRLIVVKEADSLKPEIKKFILGFCQDPPAGIMLILDMEKSGLRDDFIGNISKYADVIRFRESAHLDAFVLSRQINLKKTDSALKVLNQLLKDGEKPERILGGLRYACEKEAVGWQDAAKKIKALIECDLEIKTGKVRPDFALEKLVVKLCAPIQAAR